MTAVGNIVHIVSFDLPYPANYGGAIEVYYKIKALHDAGISVILHAFLYGEKKALNAQLSPLRAICHAIYCYPRRSFWHNFAHLQTPYISHSRRHPDLLRRLSADKHPILLEGLHCCAYLPDLVAQKRLVAVRMHNIEADYYGYLYKNEQQWLRKCYYGIESRLLRHYEAILQYAHTIFAISPADTAYLSGRYAQTQYLPAFHAQQAVVSQAGRGNYALYHGNLSVSENEIAALFLLNEVYHVQLPKLALPLVIAGKNPSERLLAAVAKHPFASLVANPSEAQMKTLVTDAHIHLLPTFQPTGIKLKLLEALFCGRFCVANHAMIAHTNIAQLCCEANDASAFRINIEQLAAMAFGEKQLQERRELLGRYFSNQQGAMQIIAAMGLAQV